MSNTFVGNPCRICGESLRYYAASKCVACHKRHKETYRRSPQGKRKQAEWSKTYSHSEKLARKKQIRSTSQKEQAALYARWYRTTPKGKLVNQVGQSKCKAKRLAAEGTHTTAQWIALKELYQHCCLRCGKPESKLTRPLEEDHVIPLSRGGTNWITNIQPLCHECNGMSGKGTNTTDYRVPFSATASSSAKFDL